MTNRRNPKAFHTARILFLLLSLSLLPSCGDSDAAPDTQRVTDQANTAVGTETAEEPSYLDQYESIDYNQDITLIQCIL